MVESKFLKWQDQDNDGLIDVCDDKVPGPEVPPCPPCQPNPNYISPDWKKKDQDSPWYDEKKMQYLITVVTSERSLILAPSSSNAEGDQHVKDLFEKYTTEAIANLLLGFDKIDTPDVRSAVREVIEHKRHYLDPRPGSTVLLQYGVACENFNAIGSITDEDAPNEEDGPSTAEIVVRYVASEIAPKMIRFRKAMNLYVRYYKVYQALNKGSLIITEGPLAGKVFTPAQMERYGDNGVWGNSTMKSLLGDLESWLNNKNYNIVGVGGGLFKQRINEIEFTFNSEYSLQKLRLWTATCGSVPIQFGIKRLKQLRKKASWKDARACAYFTKLDEMQSDLEAREPMAWIEFIEKHTYPAVEGAPDYGVEETIGSCVGEALRAEGKQLGQDILDDVFSLGDAIAHSFNKNLCSPNLFDAEVLLEDLGLKEPDGSVSIKPIAKENIVGLAWEQAFKELEASDQVFVELCANILQGKGIGAGGLGIKSLFDGISLSKLCGFKTMVLDTIKCLMNGLSLEQALGTIIKSALSHLTVQDFGELFVGLPADKQQELDALVKRKIATGKIFKNRPHSEKLTEAISDEGETPTEGADGDATALEKFKSFTLSSFTEDLKNSKAKSVKDAASGKNSGDMEPQERTLMQTLDVRNYQSQLDKNAILEAYIYALIEVYKDDLLSVVDMLNSFPGAPLIAKVIALFDCPRPPVFDPSFLDFIKSIDLPFCKNINEIALPVLKNPYEWIPKLKDWQKLIFDAVKYQIQLIIISAIVKIIVKICQILGDAICKALSIAGEIAMALPDIASGRQQVSDIIRESICGPGTSQETVDTTITDMFAKFGVGGAAFANQEDVISLFGDISLASTRTELINAFKGDMSIEMVSVADSLIEHQYPQFRAGLPNQNAITDLFKDVGNLFPADVKSAMNDFLKDLPDDDFAPANPSLCATPAQLEDFCTLRQTLLSGRATSQQAREMCEDLQDDFMNNLEEMSDLLQQDGPLANVLPPIVSPPGEDCKDSLIPFESEAAKAVVGTVLGGDLGRLKIAFARDMLGNGPGERNWGMMNMILSDTLGQPLTAHWRKADNRPQYVDFITDRTWSDISEELDEAADGFDPGALLAALDPTITKLQVGAFPPKVAGWLQEELSTAAIDFTYNNSFADAKIGSPISFKDLGINRGTTRDPDLLSMGDMGYKVSFMIDMENKEIAIIEAGKKETPDITLSFQDNNKGKASRENKPTNFLYGFDVEMYLADLERSNVGWISNIGTNTSPLDANRIKIIEHFNLPLVEDSELIDAMTTTQKEAYEEAQDENPDAILSTPLYEFLSIDDTFNKFGEMEDLSNIVGDYDSFLQCFSSDRAFSPQIYLFQDLLKHKNETTPFSGNSSAGNFLNTTIKSIFGSLRDEIVANDTAFQFGARYDDLPMEMYDYVIGENDLGYTPTDLYSDVEIDGDRLTNKDAILGVSRDQWENKENARVYYLHPMTYGGSFMNPPVYVKPIKLEGWMGLVNVLFPEFTPCKPASTNLVDFEEIESEVSTAYNNMPGDPRIKEEVDCMVEKPYHRLLERAPKAGIQGVIKAACRIYSSVHFLKALATFTTFAPKFTETYSSIFAQYVVENMEASFRDAQGAAGEFFNPFKDSEFWYAFLEQAVQTYARLVDQGQVIPPKSVLEAVSRLNDMQETYSYPFRQDLRDAKQNREIRLLRTLKNYRSERNLEAVQATEEDAKLVLKEFIITELNDMGHKLVTNLKEGAGITPKHSDLSYYIMGSLCIGGEGLTLQDEIKEQVSGLPLSGSNILTTGGELAKADGSDYSGYYHVYTDEDGQDIYMEGAYHSEDEHDILTVKSSRIIVPIGDVEDYNSSSDFGSTSTGNRPFLLEKYVSINNVRHSPSSAFDIVRGNPSGINISDIYPGTMVEVLNPQTDEPVGVEGELGVRHGLLFSIIINGTRYEIANVEVNALDTQIQDFVPAGADTKLLLCLINNLKEDQAFRLCMDYIFPLPKILSMLAIYNDMGFFASIGEITSEDGDARWRGDFETKPGQKVIFPGADDSPPDLTPEYVVEDDEDYIEGWASYNDRNKGWTPFVTTWDEWDKVVLRNSTSVIKKLFKNYYYSRGRVPWAKASEHDPTKAIGKNLREAFRRPAAARLPWFWKRRLRSNPFNAKGKMCEEK